MLIHIITCKKENTRFLQKTDPNKICMSQSKVLKINKHGYRLQCSLCITREQVKFEHTLREKNYIQHILYTFYIKSEMYLPSKMISNDVNLAVSKTCYYYG